MKICFLANAASVHIQKWATYFSKKGHEVHLVSLKPTEFDYGNIKVYVIKKIKLYPRIISHLVNFIPAYIQIKRILKKINCDVFHAVGVSGEGWLAYFTGFHPLVVTTGGTDILINTKEFKGYELLTRRVLKSADLFTCDGENGKAAMIELGADPKKIRTIHFGVDIKKFKPGKNPILKKKLFGENAKVILSAKPPRKECSVETLVEAAPLIIKKIPEARFLIIGEGEEKETLKQLAVSLNVSDKIIFAGFVPNDELPAYMNAADIIVSTSPIDDGIATSTAEGMASGLTPVVAECADNRQWLNNGKGGFLYPPRDYQKLSECTIAALTDISFAKNVATINRKTIEEKYNYWIEMEKMEKLYYDIIAKYANNS